jgi:hypothetical protein
MTLMPALVSTLRSLLPDMLTELAVLPVSQEMGLGIAVTLTFLGMALHWQLPRQRMAAEEEMKDGKLTEGQAKRRIRILAICAPTATVCGVVLLVAVLMMFAE